jgi:lipid II isoglutaminyl synthase (glutamine-hydrolysing)
MPALRVCSLYPELMNIYADRGNIAVLRARCEWRGLGFEHASASLEEPLDPDTHDLFYMGGGQDRDQIAVARDMAATKRDALHDAAGRGAVVLAVCGGYQLLGRFYRDRYGSELPGAGLFPLHTIAGGRRMIGDVLIESELEPGSTLTVAGFENHAGRTILDGDATPLGRVIAGFGNDGTSGLEGCRVGRALGTYLHGPLLPRNPRLADWLLAQALAHRSGGDPPELEPLDDTLEAEAHAVSAARARARGGRF